MSYINYLYKIFEGANDPKKRKLTNAKRTYVVVLYLLEGPILTRCEGLVSAQCSHNAS